MRKINVVLEGTGEGLLMHSAQGMEQQTAKKNPAKKYDPKEDAEKVAYRTKEGYLMIPGRCIKAAILNAAAWYKFGKTSAKQIIAGCTRIEPLQVVIKDSKGKQLKDYVIDMRPVVVQRSRIIRARPKIEDWQIEFEIIYNDELIGEIDIIRKILEEAGQRIGLLDNRPQKYGENGTFRVKKFLLVGEA
jgi:hypothetical protein